MLMDLRFIINQNLKIYQVPVLKFHQHLKWMRRFLSVKSAFLITERIFWLSPGICFDNILWRNLQLSFITGKVKILLVKEDPSCPNCFSRQGREKHSLVSLHATIKKFYARNRASAQCIAMRIELLYSWNKYGLQMWKLSYCRWLDWNVGNLLEHA